MKPTREQVMDMMKECNLIEIVARHDDGTVTAQIPNITNMKRFAALAYEAGRRDENEACAKVAESYEPRCDSCPSGVANAIRARREQ